MRWLSFVENLVGNFVDNVLDEVLGKGVIAKCPNFKLQKRRHSRSTSNWPWREPLPRTPRQRHSPGMTAESGRGKDGRDRFLSGR
jgi:hypothetical protein